MNRSQIDTEKQIDSQTQTLTLGKNRGRRDLPVALRTPSPATAAWEGDESRRFAGRPPRRAEQRAEPPSGRTEARASSGSGHRPKAVRRRHAQPRASERTGEEPHGGAVTSSSEPQWRPPLDSIRWERKEGRKGEGSLAVGRWSDLAVRRRRRRRLGPGEESNGARVRAEEPAANYLVPPISALSRRITADGCDSCGRRGQPRMG